MDLFKAIAHVAIRVRDLDATLAFYVEKLGFQEMLRLYFPDGRLMLVYLRITDDQFLEVFPDGAGDRAPEAQAIGPNHFCLEVDDLAATLQKLKAVGVEPTKAMKIGLDRNVQAWLEDPDGNRIELMQMAKDNLQTEAIARLKAGAR